MCIRRPRAAEVCIWLKKNQVIQSALIGLESIFNTHLNTEKKKREIKRSELVPESLEAFSWTYVVTRRKPSLDQLDGSTTAEAFVEFLGQQNLLLRNKVLMPF
jgi:hypothetical protein